MRHLVITRRAVLSQLVMVFWWCQECCQRVWDTWGVVTTRYLTLAQPKISWVDTQQIVDILVSGPETWDHVDADLRLRCVGPLCCQEHTDVVMIQNNMADLRWHQARLSLNVNKWSQQWIQHLGRLYLETIKVSLWTKLTDLDLIYKMLPSTLLFRYSISLYWPLEKMPEIEIFVGTVEDMKKMTNDADKDREIWGDSMELHCSVASVASVATCVVYGEQGWSSQWRPSKDYQLNCLGN